VLERLNGMFAFAIEFKRTRVIAGARPHGCNDPAPIRRLWAEHLSGQGHWHYSIWNVLMFQAWRQRWR
jgi:hypothetical protein